MYVYVYVYNVVILKFKIIQNYIKLHKVIKKYYVIVIKWKSAYHHP
jgi:hypothetical protein